MSKKECVILEKTKLNEEASCQSSCCCSSCGCSHENHNEKLMLGELVLGGLVFIMTEWLGLVPEAYHIYA